MSSTSSIYHSYTRPSHPASSQLKNALALVLDDERRDKEKKNREDFRRTDHFVRAVRLEEQPLLGAAFEVQRRSDAEHHAAAHERAVKEARERHEVAVADKRRLLRVVLHEATFREQVMKEREALFVEQKQARAARMVCRLRFQFVIGGCLCFAGFVCVCARNALMKTLYHSTRFLPESETTKICTELLRAHTILCIFPWFTFALFVSSSFSPVSRSLSDPVSVPFSLPFQAELAEHQAKERERLAAERKAHDAMVAKQAEAAAEAKRKADEQAAAKRAADEAKRAAYVFASSALLVSPALSHCLVQLDDRASSFTCSYCIFPNFLHFAPRFIRMQ